MWTEFSEYSNNGNTCDPDPILRNLGRKIINKIFYQNVLKSELLKCGALLGISIVLNAVVDVKTRNFIEKYA